MTKVPGCLDVAEAVGRTHGTGFECAHAWIKEAIDDGFVVHVRVLTRDLHDRDAPNLFGGKNAELDAQNGRF